ncbi:MAG: hypothetical protein IJ511_07895 [Bacteroides sp.]|nr:hypothetical protein [Bacteroides sp.]
MKKVQKTSDTPDTPDTPTTLPQAVDTTPLPHFSAREILQAVGVEIVKQDEKENQYFVGYQGGYFLLSFANDNLVVGITYENFNSYEMEYYPKVLQAVNAINLKYWRWTCYAKINKEESDEKPVKLSMSYQIPLTGTLMDEISGFLKQSLAAAFFTARSFNEEMENLVKQTDNETEQVMEMTFNRKILYAKHMRELGHTWKEPGEELPAASELSLGGLMELFKGVEWGCLLSMQVIHDDQIKELTTYPEITGFDLREYIRNLEHPTLLDRLTLIISFEEQDLIIHLTHLDGSTENTLFFAFNVMCSGNEMDKFRGRQSALSHRTMLEVRLSDANADYWETKFMIDDAHDKASSGRINELTDEQHFFLTAGDHIPLRGDLYWGKKYYNEECFVQALIRFNRIHSYLLEHWTELEEEHRSLYYHVAFYIGFIYMELGMRDRAFYYLFSGKSENAIIAIQEFTNCLCNMNDPGAVAYIQSTLNDVVGFINKQEEPDEEFINFYRFLNRRLAYAYVNMKEYDEAEILLNRMIVNGEDVDFAKGELDYIKRMKENNNDKKEEE